MKKKPRIERPNALMSALLELKAIKEAEPQLLPDLGTALANGGIAFDECLMIPQVSISRITTMHYDGAVLYTTEAIIAIKGTQFMASIDMLPYHLYYIMDALLLLGEDLMAQDLEAFLADEEGELHFSETPISLLLTIFLGKPEESMIGEAFIPLRILEINGVAMEKVENA